MGKAQKQRANRIAKQVKRKVEDAHFQKIIASMEDDKVYTLEKESSKLSRDVSYPGAYWKAMFLKPKTEGNENAPIIDKENS